MMAGARHESRQSPIVWPVLWGSRLLRLASLPACRLVADILGGSMTALSPDHLHLLALARAAIKARDDKELWNRSMRDAVAIHAAACNALWDELERQVIIADGAVPVLEHPSATKARRSAQMRGEIIAAVQHALSDVLDDLANGITHGEDDE